MHVDARVRVIYSLLRNRAEQYSPRRNASRVERRQQVSLAKVDKVDALASDDINHKAVEDDGAPSVSEQLIVVVGDVRHSQQIQLCMPTTSGCVDGKQDRPSDEAADDTHHGADLEEAKEEEAVEGVVVEDPCVGDPVEVRDPAEEAV